MQFCNKFDMQNPTNYIPPYGARACTLGAVAAVVTATGRGLQVAQVKNVTLSKYETKLCKNCTHARALLSPVTETEVKLTAQSLTIM